MIYCFTANNRTHFFYTLVFCRSSLTMGQNSVGRFFIEGMRTNSLWIGEWIRVSQALSLALFIGAIVVWFIRRQDYPPISYYSDGNKGQKKTIKMVN